LASAGTARKPPVSAAIDLSATMVTQGAPNDTARITSTMVATIQESLLSTEWNFLCSCICLLCFLRIFSATYPVLADLAMPAGVGAAVPGGCTPRRAVNLSWKTCSQAGKHPAG